MASASTQEKIDEPTRKFLRLPGNAVNALLIKLPAQGIPEQVNTRYCLSEVHLELSECADCERPDLATGKAVAAK